VRVVIGSSVGSHTCSAQSLVPSGEVAEDSVRPRDASVAGAGSTNGPLAHFAAVDDWSVAPLISSVAPLISSVAPLISSVAPLISSVAPLMSSVAPMAPSA
jgi:hypothetical protein